MAGQQITIRPGELSAVQLETAAQSQAAAAQSPAVAQATALAMIAKVLGGGPLLAGFVGGVIAVAGHSMLDTERIVPRVEALERGMLAADDHNAWVQQALIALSEHKPLPPPPIRRFSTP